MKFPISKPNEIPQSKTSVGLDIGNSHIKLVILKKDSNNIYLDKHFLLPISGSLQQTLNQLIGDCNLLTNKVNISLAGKSIIVRNLWLPQMKKEELKVSLGYELDKYIPFPVEDIYYDGYILDKGPLARREGQMRVIIAVARKLYVEERIELLKQEKLEPEVIDVDANCLVNVFEDLLEDKKTIAIIDIGYSKTIINITYSKMFIFTREIDYGIKKIQQSAARGLSVSIAEANKLLCEGDARVGSWQSDLVNKLNSELWNSFEFYEQQEQKSVEKICITGGGSLLPNLAASLQEVAKIPVEVLNPFNGLQNNLEDSEQTELDKTAPIYSVAVGLALRSFG